MVILNINNVKKLYGSAKGVQTEALSKINLSVNEGEFIAIMGESGSGKTTLLNIIATLDKPTEGTVTIKGKDIQKIKDKDIAAFRRNELGFVFQDFNLLDSFNNRDNIFLPLVLSNTKPSEMENRLGKIAPILGIENLLNKFPYEISGGQKQRVAIARAIITNPGLILADEPTGALDSGSSEMIMKLFQEINNKGQTILMVTHSGRAASYAERVLFIKDGTVYHEIYKGNKNSSEFTEKINETLAVLNQRGDRNED